MEQEKRLDEEKTRRILLEEKVRFRFMSGKSNNVNMTCQKCPYKVFKSQKGLYRHIVDKHMAQISQDTIFGASPPNLGPAPQPSSPPKEADLPTRTEPDE